MAKNSKKIKRNRMKYRRQSRKQYGGEILTKEQIEEKINKYNKLLYSHQTDPDDREKYKDEFKQFYSNYNKTIEQNNDSSIKEFQKTVEDLNKKYDENVLPVAVAVPDDVHGAMIVSNSNPISNSIGNPKDVASAPNGPIDASDVEQENSQTISPDRLKKLVTQSFEQTQLYLKLTKAVISENLKQNDNKNTDELKGLQEKIDAAIKALEISKETAEKLNINPEIYNDKNISGIIEILLALIGMGVISAGILGGKNKKKTKGYRKHRNYKKGKRQTAKRHRK